MESVDLTNQDLGNHYLRDVQDVFELQCAPEDRPSDILLLGTRHLKVQNSEDTYEDVYTAQKLNEFERQPCLPGLLQDTLRELFNPLTGSFCTTSSKPATSALATGFSLLMHSRNLIFSDWAGFVFKKKTNLYKFLILEEFRPSTKFHSTSQ
jgi:hypothetical protein